MTGPMRAWLFVPANRPERYAKALGSGADAVIVDLEDAVAPADKPAARGALADWLRGRGPAADEAALWVRINACDTPWHADDLALAALPGVAGVMLPKAEGEAPIGDLLSAGARAVLPLIESAAGFERLGEIAGAGGVDRLAFGSIDLQVDLGMRDAAEDELLYFRSRIVLASRAGRTGGAARRRHAPASTTANASAPTCCAPAGSASAASCASTRARSNRCGSTSHPARPRREWAQRVIAADAASGGAAVSVDGKMVDKPVLLRAQAIVGESGA